MLLWIILTVLCAIAAVIASAPFIRRLDAPGVAAGDDQKTVAEIAGAKRARPLSAIEAQRTATAVAGVVVLGAVGLYALIGNPNLAPMPNSTQNVTAAPVEGDPAAELRKFADSIPEPAGSGQTSQPASNAGAGNTSGAQALGSVDEMIERVASRLKKNPNDVNGWRMLGWSYFNTQRYSEAAEAYAKAIELSPSEGALKTARGEAMVRLAQDVVKPDAMALFDDALKADPKDPRARYFKGLAKEQAGDKKAAVEDWLSILKESAPSEPWWPDLRTRTAALGKEVGADMSTLPPEPQASNASASNASSPSASGGVLDRLQVGGGASDGVHTPTPANGGSGGPTAEDVKNAEAMPAGDQQAMIRGMVDRLAERLEKSPRDADGWIKLIRSRSVLGEADKAKAALQKAWEVFSDTPAEQERIAAEAKGLGVER